MSLVRNIPPPPTLNIHSHTHVYTSSSTHLSSSPTQPILSSASSSPALPPLHKSAIPSSSSSNQSSPAVRNPFQRTSHHHPHGISWAKSSSPIMMLSDNKNSPVGHDSNNSDNDSDLDDTEEPTSDPLPPLSSKKSSPSSSPLLHSSSSPSRSSLNSSPIPSSLSLASSSLQNTPIELSLDNDDSFAALFTRGFKNKHMTATIEQVKQMKEYVSTAAAAKGRHSRNHSTSSSVSSPSASPTIDKAIARKRSFLRDFREQEAKARREEEEERQRRIKQLEEEEKARADAELQEMKENNENEQENQEQKNAAEETQSSAQDVNDDGDVITHEQSQPPIVRTGSWPSPNSATRTLESSPLQRTKSLPHTIHEGKRESQDSVVSHISENKEDDEEDEEVKDNTSTSEDEVEKAEIEKLQVIEEEKRIKQYNERQEKLRLEKEKMEEEAREKLRQGEMVKAKLAAWSAEKAITSTSSSSTTDSDEDIIPMPSSHTNKLLAIVDMETSKTDISSTLKPTKRLVKSASAILSSSSSSSSVSTTLFDLQYQHSAQHTRRKNAPLGFGSSAARTFGNNNSDSNKKKKKKLPKDTVVYTERPQSSHILRSSRPTPIPLNLPKAGSIGNNKNSQTIHLPCAVQALPCSFAKKTSRVHNDIDNGVNNNYHAILQKTREKLKKTKRHKHSKSDISLHSQSSSSLPRAYISPSASIAALTPNSPLLASHRSNSSSPSRHHQHQHIFKRPQSATATIVQNHINDTTSKKQSANSSLSSPPQHQHQHEHSSTTSSQQFSMHSFLTPRSLSRQRSDEILNSWFPVSAFSPPSHTHHHHADTQYNHRASSVDSSRDRELQTWYELHQSMKPYHHASNNHVDVHSTAHSINKNSALHVDSSPVLSTIIDSIQSIAPILKMGLPTRSSYAEQLILKREGARMPTRRSMSSSASMKTLF